MNDDVAAALAADVAAALETARLRELAQINPTKENLVLHAVHVWRRGCCHGAPGECPECNALFLRVLEKHLSTTRRPEVLEEAWRAIDNAIVRGPLPGNGTDQSAERNGMVLACNIIRSLER